MDERRLRAGYEDKLVEESQLCADVEAKLVEERHLRAAAEEKIDEHAAQIGAIKLECKHSTESKLKLLSVYCENTTKSKLDVITETFYDLRIKVRSPLQDSSIIDRW